MQLSIRNLRIIDIDFCNNGNQGLSNKLIYLSGIIRYCIKHPEVHLVEPKFYIGTKHHTTNEKGILFSEIFDISYFNKKMGNLFQLIPRKDIDTQSLNVEYLSHHYANEYGWSVEHEDYMNICCEYQMVSIQDNILLKVLDSLKLTDENTLILNEIMEKLGDNYTAIHMRTENDWPANWNDGYLTNEKLVQLYKNSDIFNNKSNNNSNTNVFFSTGENQNEIQQLFNNINIKAYSYYDDTKLYDLKTAISYMVCLHSNTFISHPYSTFSSLITMQRELMPIELTTAKERSCLDAMKFVKRLSYSYNYNSIYKRLDKGINYIKPIHTGKNASNIVTLVSIVSVIN